MGSKSARPARSSIKLLIADSQRLFSGALATALARKYQYEVIEERPVSLEEAVRAVEVHKPDVVLLDYWLDQTASTEQVLKAAPQCKVLMISGIYGPDHVQQAVASGAAGFLPKSVSVATVDAALQRAHAGESPVFAKELKAMVERMGARHREAEEFTRRLQSLSNREMQVLVQLGSGRLIQEMAKELGISQPTVTGHINRILKKTGARSQAEVLAMARVAGVIQT